MTVIDAKCGCEAAAAEYQLAKAQGDGPMLLEMAARALRDWRERLAAAQARADRAVWVAAGGSNDLFRDLA